MNQVNLIIDCDVRNLSRSLPPMQARVGSEFIVLIFNAPDDCYDVIIRISANNSVGYIDTSATQNENGEWRVVINGSVYEDEGKGWYEVRASSALGNNTALGRGDVITGAFSD